MRMSNRGSSKVYLTGGMVPITSFAGHMGRGSSQVASLRSERRQKHPAGVDPSYPELSPHLEPGPIGGVVPNQRVSGRNRRQFAP
jgi:hypothetical protein